MAKTTAFLGIVLVSIFVVLQLNGVFSEETSQVAAATVTYHLWHDNNVTGDASNEKIQSLKVNSTGNSTFFTLMEQAAKIRPEFYVFEYEQYPFGKAITSIGGTKEDPTNNLYWMLYKINGDPNPAAPPPKENQTKYGVDQTYVADGENYLFWRKVVELEEN